MKVFILLNESSSLPLSEYAVSVDQVEAITGLDFLCPLEDEVEERLESGDMTAQWF